MASVISKIVEFGVRNVDALDTALNKMSVDIERLSKAQVPVSATKAMGNRRGGGQLQSSGSHVRKGKLSYTVRYNKEYAAYQEWGGDGKGKVVKKYSTPGRKKFYLRDPGRTIAQRALEYIKNETGNIKSVL